MTNDIFDMTDTSDLPENLAKAVTVRKGTPAAAPGESALDQGILAVMQLGVEKGHTRMSSAVIRVLLFRSKVEFTDNKVANRLRVLVEANLLHKPSRETYAVGPAPKEDTPNPAIPAAVAEVAAAAAELEGEIAQAVAAEEEDPFANLV